MKVIDPPVLRCFFLEAISQELADYSHPFAEDITLEEVTRSFTGCNL